jgi:diguanylate cyclase (GGDEF)-like protein
MVETSQLVPNQTVTISLGVAELKNDESADQWLQRADEALYRAKRAGRNAIDLAS